MSPTNPDDLERIDQEIRINELKHEADELAGGQMTHWESDDCPPDIAEQFWQNVVAYEKAPLTSHFEQLQLAGMELPAPETMTDQELTVKLWELIDQLVRLQVFVSQTNHLSDRELYTHLWSETLHEVTAALPADEYSTWHLDLLGSGSEEDTHLYLKYYADEDWRRHWSQSFPEDVIPDHVDLPFDRDQHLPEATCGSEAEASDDP